MWRSVFLSAPFLWAEIELGNPDVTAAFLERCKTAPLRISASNETLNSEGFFADNVTWFDRTNSLHILTDLGWVSSVVEDLCRPAPVLQSLEISARTHFRRRGGPVCIPPTFLGQQAPLLRNLAFISVSPTPVPNLPLRNLTSFQWTDSTAVITVGEILTLLTSVPLLEALELGVAVRSTTDAEGVQCIILSKLRSLSWTDYRPTFNLMSLLILPELKDLTIRAAPSPHINLSTILPPHNDHFPGFAEPTALKYMCRIDSRACHFFYADRYLLIHQFPGLTGHRPADCWLSSSTPISFRRVKHLTVRGFDGHPPLSDIPIGEFGSLESLELAGEVVRLLDMLRPTRRVDSEALSVPFPSLSELRLTLCTTYRGLVKVVAEVLKNRKEVGHGVKNLYIMGAEGGYSSEETSELAKFVENDTKVHRSGRLHPKDSDVLPRPTSFRI